MLILALGLPFALIACKSSANDPPASPTAAQTPADGTPPADAALIQGIDLSRNADVQMAQQQASNALLDPKTVVYADVTGDQRDEAIVPLSSGGTLGNVAYVVLTMRNNAPVVVLSRTTDRSSAGGLRMTVEAGQLIETVGEFGPEDPLCCPSMLRRTTFRWDGSKLQVAGEEHVVNPNAPKR